MAEISGDGRWLISSGYDSNLYVYYNDNTQFTLNQTITMGTSTTVILAAGISDNEWIVFGNSVGDVFVFKHNGASFIQH